MFFTKRIDNSRLVTANDPRRAQEMRSFATAMALLFALIMLYGWQHFSAIEYGYHIESEKQQIEVLNEQNRQLRLTEAQLGDPVRIDTMARQMGLNAPVPGQVVRPENGGDRAPRSWRRLPRSMPDLGTGAPLQPLASELGEVSAAVNLASSSPENYRLRRIRRPQSLEQRTRRAATIRRPRFLYVLGFFVFWTLAICLRLVWLQVMMRPVMSTKPRQQQRTFEIAPRRGNLYDRNLRELAVSIWPTRSSRFRMRSATARTSRRSPRQRWRRPWRSPKWCIPIPTIVSPPLSGSTPGSPPRATMRGSRAACDPSVIAQVKALNLKGVHIQKEFKRFYPDNRLPRNVLGYVGTDATGLGGVEQQFEDDLHGVPGHMLTGRRCQASRAWQPRE